MTRIQILQDNLIKGYLEVDDTLSLPINMGIADIRDISKKTGTFSKTITLVGGANNHQLLGHVYNLNLKTSEFDINKITYCNIEQNGVIILENAILQLVSVNKVQNTNTNEEEITYTCLIKDSASDFFNTINNKYLEDLQCFGHLNHNLTAANVIDTFDNTIAEGYKYVMPMGSSTGSTATSLINVTYNLEEFTPAIYAKKYFDSIFAQAGFTYVWDELSDEHFQFDKLLIPYNGDIQKSEKVDTVEYNASVASDIDYTIRNTTRGYAGNDGWIINKNWWEQRKFIDFNIENYDYSNLFDLTTDFYQSPNVPSANSNITFEYEYDYEIVVNNLDSVDAHLVYIGRTGSGDMGKGTQVFSVKPFTSLIKDSYNAGQEVFTQDNLDASYTYSTYFTSASHPIYSANSVTVLKSGTAKGTFVKAGIDPTKKYTITNGFNVPVYPQGTVASITGQWYFRNQWNMPGGSATNTFFEMRVTNVRLVIKTVIEGALGYNYPVIMNKFVPKKIKQSDFIKSIFTMYNLYIETDREVSNKLIIKGRDQYYDEGVEYDWTKKIAKNEEQEIKFLNDVQKKKQILTYKQDNDLPNTTYFEKFNEVYGQVEYTYASEFVKDIDKKELVFSPTPCTNLTNGAIVPMLLGPAPKVNIRILYDGGAYTCGNYSIINYEGNIVTANTFPFLNHFDRPYQPTFDINFATCDDYYDKTLKGKTNNNLFNLHWRRTINQIDTGKMLTAKFYLTEKDIKNIRLNAKILVNDVWYQINKIIDYNANSIDLTKVELLTADDRLQIKFIDKPFNESINNNSKNRVDSDMLRERIYQTNNINTATPNLQVSGLNNVIDESTTFGVINGNYNTVQNPGFVFGDNNVIQGTNLTFGSNNVVNPGINNSVIIGDNVTAATSNTLYAANIVVPEGGTINGVAVSAVTTQYFTESTGAGSIISIQSDLFDNVASGDYSLSFGNDNVASGDYSAALGGGSNTASGNYSTAFGIDNVASGDYSAVFGRTNISSGMYATAFGLGNTASGDNSLVVGFGNVVNGDRSVVLGGADITGNTNDTVYVPNLNINSTPSTGSDVDTILLRSTNGDIKQITMADLAALIGTTTMENELILKITFIYDGTSTYEVLKDDLGYASGMSLNISRIPYASGSDTFYYLRGDLTFPTPNTANKLFLKHFNGPNTPLSFSESKLYGTEIGNKKAFRSESYTYSAYIPSGEVFILYVIYRAIE